jgi:hypothetical protein
MSLVRFILFALKNSLTHYLNNMVKDDVISIEINIHLPIDSDEAKRQLMNYLYKVSDAYYEYIAERGLLSDGKKLHGNGHHCAQSICAKAEEIWDKQVY